MSLKEDGMKNRKERVASLLILIAGCCWGMIGLFSRALAKAGLDPVQLTMLRSLVLALSTGLFIGVRDREKLRIAGRDLFLFLGSGIGSIAFFNICYFLSIRENTLSLAALLLYTAPSFVVILSRFIFHEKITPRKQISLLLSFTGLFFAAGVFQSSLPIHLPGIAAGLGSGLGYALYTIFSRLALKKYHLLTVIHYTFFIAAAALLPFSRPLEIAALIAADPRMLLNILLLGWLCTLLPFVLYTKGLERIEAGKAAIFAFIEPAAATLLGVSVFGEKLTVMNLGGIALIVLSIVILNQRSPDIRSE